jgi:hypothetical protein
VGKINCNCKLGGFTLQRRGIPHKSSPVPVYEVVVVQHDKLLIVVGQGIPHKFQVSQNTLKSDKCDEISSSIRVSCKDRV